MPNYIQLEFNFVKDLLPPPKSTVDSFLDSFAAFAGPIIDQVLAQTAMSYAIYSDPLYRADCPSIPLTFLFGPKDQYEFEFAKQLTRDYYSDWDIEFHADQPNDIER